MGALVQFEPKQYDFIISKHMRERFVERFSSKKFQHLSKCRNRNSCKTCFNLTYKLAEEVENKKRAWNKIICAKLHEAKEIKVHRNNHDFMEAMIAKYGDKNVKLYLESDILFVVIANEDGRKVAVTCLDVKSPINGFSTLADFAKRPKYGKRK